MALHLRIDPRLVHIGTVEGYCRPLGLKNIVVINQDAFENGLKQMLMRICAEPDFEVHFYKNSDEIPAPLTLLSLWVCDNFETADSIVKSADHPLAISVSQLLKDPFERLPYGDDWTKRGHEISFLVKALK